MRGAVVLFVVATDDQLAIRLQRNGGRARPGITRARKVGLYLAAGAKSLIKSSVRVVPDYHKVIKFAVGPGAAHARHDDFAVSLQGKRPGFRGPISESRFDTPISPKRLVKTA